MENNLFKQSWILIKNNVMGVLEPLLFLFFVVTLVLTPITTKTSIDIGFIISASLGFLCFTAFLSGWFACIKKAITFKNRKYSNPSENSNAQIEILKNFFPGVAEYMLPMTIYMAIYFILSAMTVVGFRLCSMKVIAMYKIPKEFFDVAATSSQQKIMEYIPANLTVEQLQIILLLFISGFVVYFLFTLVVLWFAPAMYYDSKNPITAIFLALKFLFKNFGMSFLIVFVMFLINLILSVINAFIGSGFLVFIPLCLVLVYLLYYVTTVFMYYESKTQNNSTCGTQLDREV